MFNFEKTPFRKDGGGEILFFGYPLFGGWLPFIGIRTIRVENDGEAITFIDEDGTTYDYCRTLSFEWFLCSYNILLTIK